MLSEETTFISLSQAVYAGATLDPWKENLAKINLKSDYNNSQFGDISCPDLTPKIYYGLKLR